MLKSGNESTARQLKFRNVIHHRCKVESEGLAHPEASFNSREVIFGNEKTLKLLNS